MYSSFEGLLLYLFIYFHCIPIYKSLLCQINIYLVTDYFTGAICNISLIKHECINGHEIIYNILKWAVSTFTLCTSNSAYFYITDSNTCVLIKNQKSSLRPLSHNISAEVILNIVCCNNLVRERSWIFPKRFWILTATTFWFLSGAESCRRTGGGCKS